MPAHSENIARLGIGGNLPPEPTIIERLKETYSLEVGAVDDLAARANAAPAEIRSDDELAAIGDIAAAAGKKQRELDTLRETEKRPFLAAGREVDGFFKTPIDRLDRIKRAMTDRATKFQRAKADAERRAREEAERRARAEAEERRLQAEKAAAAGRIDDAVAEAEAAAQAERAARQATAETAAKASDMTRVRSESGTLITTKTEMAFEVENYDAIPLDKLRPYLDRAAIDKAIRAFMKINKAASRLGGVRFFEAETAVFK